MQSIRSRWGQKLVFGLPVLLIAGLGLVLYSSTTTAAPTYSSISLPAADTTVTCPHAPEEVIEVGGAAFTGQFDGSLTATTGKSFHGAGGLKSVPLRVRGAGARAFVEGLGEVNWWLDSSRPVASVIRENSVGAEFPATQEMRFNFFLTTESMPGRVLRTRNPAILVNTDVRAFPPPPGTHYRLMRTIELEDVDQPGQVVAKVTASRPTIGTARIHERAQPQVQPEQ